MQYNYFTLPKYDIYDVVHLYLEFVLRVMLKTVRACLSLFRGSADLQAVAQRPVSICEAGAGAFAT